MKPRHKRMAFVLAGIAGVAVAAFLILNAFRSNIVFAFSPSEVRQGKVPAGANFRLGGLVEKGSLQRDKDGLTVHFVVTDLAESIKVTYRGLLPDLFQEGAGAVSLGKMDADGSFHAEQVLAKHDEKYMPPEAAKALQEARFKRRDVPVNLDDGGVAR